MTILGIEKYDCHNISWGRGRHRSQWLATTIMLVVPFIIVVAWITYSLVGPELVQAAVSGFLLK